MPRFHKLLEQEYLKLDIKGDELNDIQKNLIDKMVSSGKAKYEGMEKMCGIISYDVDGKKGKYKIDQKGAVTPHVDSEEEEEDQESSTSGYDPKSMSQSDIGVLRTLMNPQQKRVVDTVTQGVVNAFAKYADTLTKKLTTTS